VGHAGALLDTGSQIVSMDDTAAWNLGISYDPSVLIGMGFPWGQFAEPVPTPCRGGTGFVEYPWVGGFPACHGVLPLSEGPIISSFPPKSTHEACLDFRPHKGSTVNALKPTSCQTIAGFGTDQFNQLVGLKQAMLSFLSIRDW